MMPQLAELGICGYDCKEFGGPGLNEFDIAAVLYEITKIDASLGTFLGVHNSLGVRVIDKLGDEQQRARLLPDCIALKKFACFGLTEPDYGSDATSLKAAAKRVDGGYVLNGTKRWIGNATFADYIVIWARNDEEGGKIQGFVVEKGSKGLTTKKIENKYALRMVQK